MATEPRYVLEKKLGEGGMGEVWLAKDQTLGRSVAIKVIKFGGDEDTETVLQRFRIEAMAAANLKHKGIVVIHDFVQVDANAWIVMELIDGTDLAKILKDVTPERGVAILEQAAKALDFAHDKGIFHRDIKPPNLMVDHEDHVKVMDFGVAKIAGTQGLTKAGVGVGSEPYMPPEGFYEANPPLDRRDQYALGVVAFEILAGRRPFVVTDDDSRKLHIKIALDPPPLELLSKRGFTDSVSAVIAKVLSKDYRDRYGSCREFATALGAALEESVWHATRHKGTAAMRVFVDRFPKSRLVPEAYERIAILRAEETVWERIGSPPSVLSLHAFLAAFPDGAHAPNARAWLAYLEGLAESEWRAVEQSMDPEAVQAYLRRHPYGRFAAAAHSRIANLSLEAEVWSRIRGSLGAAELAGFLSTFPNGAHTAEARKRLADLEAAVESEWRTVEESVDVAAIQAYLDRNAHSRFAPAAQARIALLRVQSAASPPVPPQSLQTRGMGVINGTPDIDWVEIPAGEFIYQDKKKRRRIERFSIARYPVTNAQWNAFLEAEDGYKQDRWWKGLDGADRTPVRPAWPEWNHPRERVSWFEASAFCVWLSEKLGRDVRLPTEEQWERAARGTDGRIYPWGNEYATCKANTSEEGLRRTSAVGSYPEGASPEGVMDLSGNVWEWCLDWYTEGESRGLRGGSWDVGQSSARAVNRYFYHPGYRFNLIGFRVCASPIR